MPGKETINALFVSKTIEEYREKKSLYMCFVDLLKAFNRVRKVVEWAMRSKEIQEIVVKAVISLYKEATTKIKVEQGYSNEFPVKVSVYQQSVL